MDATREKLAIGLDIGATRARAAVVHEDGKIVSMISRESMLRGNQDRQTILSEIGEFCRKALEAASKDLRDIAGIGIGICGQIDRKGALVGATIPREAAIHFEPVNIRESVSRSFGSRLPVIVENDCKAAAWGEYRFGAGRGKRNMICLTIGTGIGGGVILDGELYHGKSGLAGHFGSASIDLRGLRDLSGTIGSAERYASGTGIARSAQIALQRNRGSRMAGYARGDPATLSCEDVFAAATHDSDDCAVAVICNAARVLGVLIVNLVHLLGPDIVVLGGGVVDQGDAFVRPVKEAVMEYGMPGFAETPIALAKLGTEAGVVGAAALCFRAAGEDVK